MPSVLDPLRDHIRICTKCTVTFDGKSTSLDLCKEGKRLYRMAMPKPQTVSVSWTSMKPKEEKE